MTRISGYETRGRAQVGGGGAPFGSSAQAARSRPWRKRPEACPAGEPTGVREHAVATARPSRSAGRWATSVDSSVSASAPCPANVTAARRPAVREARQRASSRARPPRTWARPRPWLSGSVTVRVDGAPPLGFSVIFTFSDLPPREHRARLAAELAA